MTWNSPLRIGVAGDWPVAKRIADAVAAQPDMMMAGFVGSTSMQSFAELRGIGIFRRWAALTAVCDVMVEVGHSRIRIFPGHPTNEDVSPTRPSDGGAELIVPHPDIVGLSRIVHSVRDVCRCHRLQATVIRRCTQDIDDRLSCVDGLTPVLADETFDTDLMTAVGDVLDDAHVRAVTAPITHSHLLMLRLSLEQPVIEECVLGALLETSRIVVGESRDGFRSTADIDEFFRDLPRPRGDRWELFVWRDSLICQKNQVYLMADLSPDALPIPETLDAIRQVGDPQATGDSVRKATDNGLKLLKDLAEEYVA